MVISELTKKARNKKIRKLVDNVAENEKSEKKRWKTFERKERRKKQHLLM